MPVKKMELLERASMHVFSVECITTWKESGCASSMTNFEFCRGRPHSMELPTLVLMYSWYSWFHSRFRWTGSSFGPRLKPLRDAKAPDKNGVLRAPCRENHSAGCTCCAPSRNSQGSVDLGARPNKRHASRRENPNFCFVLESLSWSNELWSIDLEFCIDPLSFVCWILLLCSLLDLLSLFPILLFFSLFSPFSIYFFCAFIHLLWVPFPISSLIFLEKRKLETTRTFRLCCHGDACWVGGGGGLMPGHKAT